MISRSAGALLAAVAIAAGIAGCGGSSKSSSSTTTSVASSSSAGGTQLSKTRYEQTLGPLLNQQVAPALRTALANGGLADPKRLAVAIANVKLAHDKMAAVNPPAAIADLHQKAVAALGAILVDMQKLRAAELQKNRSAGLAALKSLKTDAIAIVTVGNNFQSRGF